MKLELTNSRSEAGRPFSVRYEVGFDWDLEATLIEMLKHAPHQTDAVLYIIIQLDEVELSAISPEDEDRLKERVRRTSIGYMMGQWGARRVLEPAISIEPFPSPAEEKMEEVK